MLIGVDGNDANVKQKVGVSVYTYNLLLYFKKEADQNTQFQVYLREPPQGDLPEESQYFHYKVVKGPRLWSQIFLPIALYTGRKVDVFFSPAHYSPRFSPAPLVVTIHDLAYFYYPEEFLKEDFYKLKNWTRDSVLKAKKIIAVSENTKKDLLKFYRIPAEQIKVVHNGFEKNISNPTAFSVISKKYTIKKELYVLYVGTLQPRKNVTTLIDAFEKYQKTHPEMKLILVGKKGWLYDDIFSKVQKSPVRENIIFTDYLPDEDVVTLYQNAYCFVLPSLYEGFGVPILEAMSYGCPAISSFTSSLAEVGGDACIYFDPEKVDGLVDDLESLQNKKLRSDLINNGKERVKQFSWQKCAQETLSVLKNI